jgi:hypothetical protein
LRVLSSFYGLVLVAFWIPGLDMMTGVCAVQKRNGFAAVDGIPVEIEDSPRIINLCSSGIIPLLFHGVFELL